VRPYGVVHRGFFNAFAVAQSVLVSILKAAGPSEKKVWITGHSLGGALAMIAGAELADSLPISGFYTYGQPKTGNGQVRSYFQQRFSGKFQRFVNADDIVPKVPPGYTHAGRLFWFDDQGDLKSSSDAEAAVEAESTEAVQQPPEMSEPEFQEFQRELKAIKAATGGQTEAFAESAEGIFPGRTGAFEESAEGIFPSISDHDLGRYIRRIRRYAETNAHVDGVLEQAIAANAAARAGLEFRTRSLLRSGSANPVLLRVKSSTWKPPAGMKVDSRLGTIITAQCSIEQIERLRQDPDVFSIEASREAGVAELSVSLPFVKATDVHVPPLDERGDSAIVAVIDAGIDVLHEAFRDAAGQTRIVALWHQKIAANGRTPNAVDPVTYTQDYGRLFLSADIQQMIANPAQTPEELRDALPPPHGTHVASIAAGRAVGPFVGGLAPEAKIIVVIPDMVTEPGSPLSIGYSNSHVDALSFIRATAEKLKLPVAVNVSLGMNAGAHDGTSTLEAGFDQFSGLGRDPGLVIIKSAGNERGFKGHAAAIAMQAGVSQIEWTSDTSIRQQDYIEAWFSGYDDIAFTLIDPAGNRSATVSAVKLNDSATLGGNHCQLSLTPFHRDNGDNRLVISIQFDTRPIQPGRWILEMNGLSIPGGGEVHAWVERDASRAVTFSSGDNDEMTLSIPGTARTVITVAACDATNPVRLTNSSSWGLTRDKRPKPDLCAPGKQIVAALANTDDHQAVMPQTGTSMAAPHVTGAVALLLSRLHKNPAKAQVNALQVRGALIRTATHFTGQHNKGFGYGVLNVRDFLNQF
jgi:endonuclease G